MGTETRHHRGHLSVNIAPIFEFLLERTLPYYIKKIIQTTMVIRPLPSNYRAWPNPAQPLHPSG